VVQTTVAHASQLFSVPFYHYQHSNGKHALKIFGEATVPSAVSAVIDFVAGISELFTGSPIKTNSFHRPKAPGDVVITPSVLKQYYQVPNLNATNSQNLQGIAAFQDYFSLGALQAFTQ
jgi:hypothetical protein